MFPVRSALVPLLLLVAASACNCEDTQTTDTFGQLELSPRAADFGTGCVSDTLTREIVVSNFGNRELEILDVSIKGSSAFTIVESLPQFIEPGEDVKLVVALTPETSDDFAATLTVTSDAAEDPEQSVTLLGKGFSGERYDLKALCERSEGSGVYETACYFLNFDNVLTGTSLERKFLLKNEGCGAVRIDALSFVPDEFDESGGADALLFSLPDTKSVPFEVGGLSQELVTVRYSPVEPGSPLVRLVVRSTDPGEKQPGEDPGTWDLGLFANSVAPALLVTPDILTFFEASAGVALEKKIVVSNTGLAPLSISALSLVPEAGTQDFAFASGTETSFTLPPTGQAGSEREIGVVYTSSGPGTDRAKVTVSAGAESAEVTLIGGTEPLLVTRWVDPDTSAEREGRIDFGITAIGQKDIERTVRLYNEGQAPLSVSAIEIVDNPGGGYRLQGATTGSIAPGARTEFKITFDDAVHLINDSAKLRIASNDPVDSSVGGERFVDLVSQNQANFKPVPIITVCPKVRPDAASCSSNPTVGGAVEIDALQSSGPEAGDTLTYLWTLPNKPTGSTARIENDTADSTRIVSDDGLVVDVAGTYYVRLAVKDQYGNESVITQAVTVR